MFGRPSSSTAAEIFDNGVYTGVPNGDGDEPLDGRKEYDGMGYPNFRQRPPFGWGHDCSTCFEAPGSQRKASQSKDLVVDGPKRLSA